MKNDLQEKQYKAAQTSLGQLVLDVGVAGGPKLWTFGST